MKPKYLAILICLNTNIQAQKNDYEKLEFYSSEISKIQSTANEKIYTDGAGFYEVSFNDANFTLYFNNHLATKSVYKKGASGETLSLIENIDFSKAIDVKNMALGGLAGSIRVSFPKGYITTQQYENGNLLKTINESYLEFFYDKANLKDAEKLRSLLNEMIAVIKEMKNQPYEHFLNQSIFYNNYDKPKREMQLQTLIGKGNSEAMRLKGEDYENKNDYDNAVVWYEKAYRKDNYATALYNMAICKILGRGYTEDYNGYKLYIREAANLGSAEALYSLASTYSRAHDYSTAASYAEKAISKGFLYDKFINAQAYKQLFYYYGKLNQYSKIAAILTDETIYGSGLSEVELLAETYSLLIGNGSCKEATGYFTKMTEGANTKEVKARLYEYLGKIYYEGCDGSRGNKIKKDKKLAYDFYAKSRAAVN